MSEQRLPPYPPETRAKGWRFELDLEQIRQSTTWARTKPEARAWLLMLWACSWEQAPCGSLPDDRDAIAGLIGVPEAVWRRHADALMRGWWRAQDGRLYHDTLCRRVDEMMARRRSDSDRKARERARKALEAGANPPGDTPESRVTPAGLPPDSSTDNRQPNTSSSPSSKKRTPPPCVGVPDLVAEGFDEATAAEFIAHKARLKAPLTERAWADHLREASKAGWSPMDAAAKVMAKSWKGFEAKYVAGEASPANRGSNLVEVPAWKRERAHSLAVQTGGLVGKFKDQPEIVDAEHVAR